MPTTTPLLPPRIVYAAEITATVTPAVEATTSPEYIKKQISFYVDKYNVSEKLMNKIIQCESGFYWKAWNKKDPHGGAKGIAQFLQPTFDKWSELAGIKNADIWDVDNQLETMAYMLSKGEARQWSCYKSL